MYERKTGKIPNFLQKLFPEIIESPFSYISTFPLYIHSYTDSPSLYVIPEVVIEQDLTG